MKKVVIFLIISIGTIYILKNSNTDFEETPITQNEIISKPIIKSPKMFKPKRTVKKRMKPHSKIKIKTNKIHNNKSEFVPMYRDGQLSISHVNILEDEKLIISHGDIIVGDYNDREAYIRGEKTLLIPPPMLWRGGKIPYEIESQDGFLHDVTSKTIKYFNQNTKLKFVPRELEDDDYIFFKEGNRNCYSRLGRQKGMQVISLSKGCTMQKVAHEILHSLGFLHEQNRSDRDEYISILWQNIDPDLHMQFKKITNFGLSASKTKFSFNSIMLYPSNAFSIVEDDYSIVTVEGDEYETTQDILNKIDKKRIEILYKNELNP
jgi:hypothetical protein